MEKIPIFDTHAHLDLEPFSTNCDLWSQRIESGTFPEGFTPKEFESIEIEMVGVLLPGIDLRSSEKCVALTERSEKFHAAVAVHPNGVAQFTESDWPMLEALAFHPKVVAIGETGLDRYWDHSPIELQVDYFKRHIELSRQTDKPILIHNRDAWDDLLPILRGADLRRGVIHAFSGTAEQALQCVELGYHISFAGSVTYTNKKFAPLWEAAKVVPAEKLLVETDAPYMTPHPFRGKLQRNEPIMSAVVAARLAELRSVPLSQIAETTTQNAIKLFQSRDSNGAKK